MNMGCCNGGYHEFNLDWFIKRFNEIQSEWDGTKEWLKNWVESFNISGEVKKVLQSWIDDGTFERLINEEILNDINTKVEKNSSDIASVNTKVEKNTGDIASIKNTTLIGKQIDWFGDSIIRGEMPGGAIAEKPIPTLFAELTGATCVNHAQSGATISNNVWATKIINQVNSADLTNSDYVIVQGGINDYLLNYPTGAGTLEGTFINGLYNIFNTIADKNGRTKIIMLTMFPNNALYNGSLGHDGQNFIDYNNAIQDLCEDRGIRCIDMTYSSINRRTFSNVSSDGTHFNQLGYNILTVSLLNAINTAATKIRIRSGNNLMKGMFPTMDLTGTDETNSSVMRHGNCILIRPGEKIYTCVAMNLLAIPYTITFRMRVKGGTANIEFGTESKYPAIGKLNKVPGTDSIRFIPYAITINPTTFNERMCFTMTEDSTCEYAIISQICMVPGVIPAYGDEVLNNQAQVALKGFNSAYPLLFKQRDRFVVFNGPVQVQGSQIPANTELADLSYYNFAKGIYCPASGVIYASGIDGTVYPLLLDFTTYKLKTLKTIPANTNLGITSVIDIS